MFEHNNFDKYSFEEIPLNCDIYIVDECYMHDYEQMMLESFDGAEYKSIGYVSYVAARKVNDNSLELSWYANVHDRFHEVSITLPKDRFVACVGIRDCDDKPKIFVNSDWLENIYLRSYSVFCMIDAIGVKSELENGGITRDKLVKLRDDLDTLAEKYPDISFISFADSLLLKSNWSVGHFKSDVSYTYEPEIFISVAEEVNDVYMRNLGLETYAIIAQGSNEYYDDSLLHISKKQNHISLNSLGAPFAQLMEIEHNVRKCIRSKEHPASELYLEEQYYHSLRFEYGFEKNKKPSSEYDTKIKGSPCRYFYSTRIDIAENLKSNRD